MKSIDQKKKKAGSDWRRIWMLAGTQICVAFLSAAAAAVAQQLIQRIGSEQAVGNIIPFSKDRMSI